MEYTKGEWKAWELNEFQDYAYAIHCHDLGVDIAFVARYDLNPVEIKANAHLIAAAPLGYELAEFISRILATWIKEGLFGIGEGDYTRMKQLALEFLAKAKE